MISTVRQRSSVFLRLLDQRAQTLWLTASPLRAVSETLAIVGVVIAFALIAAPVQPRAAIVQLDPTLMILAGPVGAIWCALRLRPAQRVWWLEAIIEGLLGLILGLVPFGIAVASAYIFVVDRGLGPRLPSVRAFGVIPLPWLAGGLFAAFILEFVVARFAVRLGMRWNQLRRTQLRWSLTHAHLLAAALTSAMVFSFVTLLRFTLSGGRTSIFQIIPGAFFMLIVTSIGLVILLPSSAIVSAFLARYMNRRLQTLTNATAALRAGDYAVRIPVTGEDELAQLQRDFNTMASALEKAMRDLQAERDNVATLLRARRELVAGVSHDLRTPLATLRGYLESAHRRWEAGVDDVPDQLRRDLEVMERETLTLQALIDDLFTLSRAEVGHLEVRPAPTDVVALARILAAGMAPLAWQRSRIEVVAEAAYGVPQAQVDPHRLEQALRNLAQNALRHTPPGGIIAITVATKGEAVLVSVKDTGEGINEEDLPHIWERFYRGANAVEKGSGGTGLGLALVKELTEAMGGSVSVESVPGQGSCFTLRLPVAAKVASQEILTRSS